MLTIIITIVGSILASSGFWLFIIKMLEKKDVKTEVLIGLAHDRIIFLGMSYINRGSISRDEYENLHDYLYAPYVKMGGNGCAKRIMMDVDKLPISSDGCWTSNKKESKIDFQ
ncbi:TPA: hypothetical protein DCQ22_03935 [Candidatus Nomurabacteria bacterium]|nr:hypothetical protein [Candidatus Nomurabacteria bacterium]